MDVGAAAGYYCFLARKLAPNIEVHAVNPDPKFIKWMKENMKLNSISNISIHPFAISGKSGTCEIKSGDYGARIEKGNHIKMITLDAFFEKFDGNVFLLKMDIQGEEFNALRGAARSFSRIEKLLIGTHGTQIHRECLDFLRNQGFSIIHETANPPNQPDGIIVASLS